MKRNATITLTLCHDCAQVIREDKSQVIRRADMNQKIMEPCDICRRKGWEYEVSDANASTSNSVLRIKRVAAIAKASGADGQG